MANNDPVRGGENNNTVTLRGELKISVDLCHLELEHGHSEPFNHTLCSIIGCAINTNGMNIEVLVPKIMVVDVEEGGSINIAVQFWL